LITKEHKKDHSVYATKMRSIHFWNAKNTTHSQFTNSVISSKWDHIKSQKLV